MNIHILRKFLSYLLMASLLLPTFSWAQTGEAKPVEVEETKAPAIDLQDLALPTDMKELTKQSGSVYYSATAKNKPLMPVHFWGEVGKPGLHYIPVDSKLIKGLSYAGGGSSAADLEEVTVNRLEQGRIEKKQFDLLSGGSSDSHEFTLRSGDTVFIKRDNFQQNRAFYISLIGVIATIISSIFIIKRIESIDRNQ